MSENKTNKTIVVRTRVGEVKIHGFQWKFINEGYEVHSMIEQPQPPESDTSAALVFSVVASFPVNEVMGIWFEDAIASVENTGSRA